MDTYPTTQYVNVWFCLTMVEFLFAGMADGKMEKSHSDIPELIMYPLGRLGECIYHGTNAQAVFEWSGVLQNDDVYLFFDVG